MDRCGALQGGCFQGWRGLLEALRVLQQVHGKKPPLNSISVTRFFRMLSPEQGTATDCLQKIWKSSLFLLSQILKRFTKKQYHSNHYFCLLLNKLIYELNSFEVLIFRDLKGVLRPNILELQWWKGSPASTEHDSERNESRICTLVCVLVLWRDKTGSGFGKT